MVLNLTARDEDNIMLKRRNKKMMELKSKSMNLSDRTLSNKQVKDIDKIKVENNLNAAFSSNYKV